MLNDQFLNLACLCCISDDPRITNQVAKDIMFVLEFYQTSEDIAMNIALKFELALCMSKLKYSGQGRSVILDSIRTSEKFATLENFIILTEEKELDGKRIDDAVFHIHKRKQLADTIASYKDLRQFVEDFEGNNFASMDDAIDAHKNLATGMYTSISEARRREDVRTVRSLNLIDDDFTPVVQRIIDNYSGTNSIPTGFRQLDELINDGFEPGRLYIFAGASSDGKSTLLENFIRNSIERKRDLHDGQLPELHAYITLENFVDESLLRLYCSVSDKSHRDVIKNIDEERHNIGQSLKKMQLENDCYLDMAYFPSGSIAVPDLLMHLEELKQKWEGRAELKCVYLDYLDLVRSGQTIDLYRLEMGQITVDLKVLAATLGVPVVTVTQLNRSSYDKKEQLSLAMIGESIKKVEHADFMGLIRYSQDLDEEGHALSAEGTLSIYIGKNRSGPKHKKIQLRTDYSKFRIDDHERSTIITFNDATVSGFEIL